MNYWIKTRDGKIYKGKANTWNEVSIGYGDKLYNPYTRSTVIGWNRYKQIMAQSQNTKYGKG